jgi:hypothetical protein
MRGGLIRFRTIWQQTRCRITKGAHHSSSDHDAIGSRSTVSVITSDSAVPTVKRLLTQGFASCPDRTMRKRR